MEVAAFILFLFLFFLVRLKFKESNKRFEDLDKQIKALKREIAARKEAKPDFTVLKEPSPPVQEPGAPVHEPPPVHEKPAHPPQWVDIPPASAVPPASPVPPPLSIEPLKPVPPKPDLDDALLPAGYVKAKKAGVETPHKEPSKPKYGNVPYKPSALDEKWNEFKANVDWEQFTGVKLFAWLGGLALFIGAIFFVKYSIDNNLIPPQLRLAIGAAVGLAMVVSSLFIDRDRFKTTVHTMAAGGIAVLYAVTFTATVYYGFLPKLAGFAIVALLSAAAFVLAVFHRGRFISVLGALGAYATPLLIQTGHPNLAGLFIYLTVVNIGLFEVIRRTGWLPLSVLVTVGTLLTLSAGAWGTKPPAENYLIAIIALANLIFFSVFFRLYRGANAASRSIVLSLRILFISVLLVALTFVTAPENSMAYLPLAVVAAATLVALVLSYAERYWSIGFLVYAFAGFVLIAFWSVVSFNLSEPSWEMPIFFLYSVIAGIGPIFVIRRHGIESNSLYWFKSFPVAMAALAVIVFMKSDATSFFFWPMLVGVGAMGVFIAMLAGSILSVAALIIVLLIGGVGWIFRTPVISIGNEFFIFILITGLLISFLTVLFLKKASSWSLTASGGGKKSSRVSFPASSEWITALPVIGPFLLLTLVLMRQYPVAPNPAMAAGLCFLIVAVFLARYFKSQEILSVSLAAMAVTISSWSVQSYAQASIAIMLLGWSSFLWLAALITPNIVFRPEEDWKIGWSAWAVFELVMACLAVFAVDTIWQREIAGWAPLALAVLKLPVIAILLKRMEGKAERNTILAFHGGVLLFYVSSICVLLLGNSWIGVAFVIEAMLLLWLNRRIEHPGLRWVSLVLAPAGFAFLLSDINTLKTAQSMPVLNLAVLSCAICVAALSVSVKLAGYPRKNLAAGFSLPEYFLWLAAGTGFFLLNMVVSDIFGGAGGGFKLDFFNDINQYVSHTLLWTIFGSLLLRIRRVPPALKFAGLIVMLAGVILSVFAPFHFSKDIGTMMPLFNPALVLFVPVVAILFYLAAVQSADDEGAHVWKNLFTALGIAVGLLGMTVELGTVFNGRTPFDLIAGHSSAMALAVIVAWFLFGAGLVLWPRPLNGAFRLTGAVLIVISLARAVYYPLFYSREFGAVTPLLNIPTAVFLLLITGLAVLTLWKMRFEWLLNGGFSSRGIWGGLLILFCFYVTNVEVASFFGMFHTGADAGRFTFYTHERLSQQLAYSISWLVFAIVLLVIGIRWRLIQIRWVALSLFVLTVLKVFIKDLWSLGQLYRVFSFIGLAVTLILVSFIYQRYLGGKVTKGDAQ